ncbi:MAG: hypothetical protein NZZ41_01615 [Candidatus Dojkabacteria bacterium]|nr:hypothetical protein [Candidatus Dojkabacteria bacterium]
MKMNIQVFLESLLNNLEFRQYCIDNISEARGDIISFTENPNCGCKKRLIEYISHHLNPSKIDKILNDWKEKIPQLNLENVKIENSQNTSQNNNQTNENTNNSSTQINITDKKVKTILREPQIMVGHVVEIPASPQEYRNFIEMTKNEQWIFRGLNILEKTKENGQKVWLIFLF